MDFEQIEDAIINGLKSGVSYLRTVETYAGQLEGDIGKLTIRFPAALVAYGGSGFKRVDGPNHQESVDFSVLVAAKDLRGSEEAKKKSQGAYDLVKDVLAALTNRSFGLDIERLRPVRVSLVYIGRGVAVYGMDFQTSFDATYQW
jgi:phage gp37-like protein